MDLFDKLFSRSSSGGGGGGGGSDELPIATVTFTSEGGGILPGFFDTELGIVIDGRITQYLNSQAGTELVSETGTTRTFGVLLGSDGTTTLYSFTDDGQTENYYPSAVVSGNARINSSGFSITVSGDCVLRLQTETPK